MANKYGVRIYPVKDSDLIIVRQTIKKPESQRYVIDTWEDGMYRQTFRDVNDTESIADAVRQALKGKLIGELKPT